VCAVGEGRAAQGWQELGLADKGVDALIASQNVELLRALPEWRVPFQRKYFDERFLELIRDGEDVVTWVRELNLRFGRWFLEWFEARKAESTVGSGTKGALPRGHS